MSNLLQNGAVWLAGQLKDHAGRSVVLSRKGATSSDPIIGTVAAVQYEVVDETGIVTLIKSFDWTFTAADVMLAGVQVEPRPGDRLAETLNGAAVQYEVMDLGKKPAVEWLDSSGIMLLVHTKKVQ